MYATTLALGLGERPIGPSFVNHVLEPLLQATEGMLRQHAERGELEMDDARYAALAFLSPVVLALLHQDSLSGVKCRPLDLPRTIERHVDAFLRAFRPAARAA